MEKRWFRTAVMVVLLIGVVAIVAGAADQVRQCQRDQDRVGDQTGEQLRLQTRTCDLDGDGLCDRCGCPCGDGPCGDCGYYQYQNRTGRE